MIKLFSSDLFLLLYKIKSVLLSTLEHSITLWFQVMRTCVSSYLDFSIAVHTLKKKILDGWSYHEFPTNII